MIRHPIRPAIRYILASTSVVLVCLGYIGLSARQKAQNPHDTTVPNVTQLREGIVKAITPQPRSGDVWLTNDARATLTRFAIGISLSVVVSLILGTLMGCWAPAEAFFEPLLLIASKLNPVAMLAVFMVLVGVGEALYTAIIITGVLPSLTIAIHHAIKHDVPSELICKAYTLGASHLSVVWNVVLRHALPRIIEATRSQVGPALIFLMAAETLVGDWGFGVRIRLESRILDMKVVYPYIALLAIFGYTLDKSLRVAVAMTCPWFGETDGSEAPAKNSPLLSRLFHA